MELELGIQRPSAGWLFYVKCAFALATSALLFGIWLSPTNWWVKGYLTMGALFAVGSAITLAKTIRDEHEARRLISRISEARTEKLLKDYAE